MNSGHDDASDDGEDDSDDGYDQTRKTNCARWMKGAPDESAMENPTSLSEADPKDFQAFPWIGGKRKGNPFLKLLGLSGCVCARVDGLLITYFSAPSCLQFESELKRRNDFRSRVLQRTRPVHPKTVPKAYQQMTIFLRWNHSAKNKVSGPLNYDAFCRLIDLLSGFLNRQGTSRTERVRKQR